MGRRWPSFKAPEHVVYFDFPTLSLLIHQAGLNPVRRLPYPHAFPFGLIVAKFGFALPSLRAHLKIWVPATTLAAYVRLPNGQHPASLVPNMVRVWRTSGADIVEAVKSKRGRESLSSKLGAPLFYLILNKLSGFHFKGASDFKLMNRKAVNAWLEMRERNMFFRGMTAWMGFTTVQIPFEVVPRSAGQSTWSALKRLKLALIGITTFSSFPLHLVTFAGVLFLGLSVLLGLETLYLKLAGRAVSGFTTVILLELIIGSFLMISLGIIGEYLARIYEEVKRRPRYLVTESIEPKE